MVLGSVFKALSKFIVKGSKLPAFPEGKAIKQLILKGANARK